MILLWLQKKLGGPKRAVNVGRLFGCNATWKKKRQGASAHQYARSKVFVVRVISQRAERSKAIPCPRAKTKPKKVPRFVAPSCVRCSIFRGTQDELDTRGSKKQRGGENAALGRRESEREKEKERVSGDKRARTHTAPAAAPP